MGKKNQAECVCWLNEDERIVSFHYEEGFDRKEFASKLALQKYVVYAIFCGYRLQ